MRSYRFQLGPVKKELILLFTLVACIALALYVEFIVRTAIVYTHLFYIPILLAGVWFHRKAVYLALGLGVVHILVTLFSPLTLSASEFLRATIFVLVAYVIGYVSEQRAKSEDALRESEERYDTFFDSTSDLAFLKDDQFRFIFVNKTFSEYCGKKEEEIIGKTDFDFMPEPVAEQYRYTDKKAIAAGTILLTEEQAGDRILETRKFTVRLGDNKIGVGAYIRDITERKRAEAALQASEQRHRSLFEDSPISLWLEDFSAVKSFFDSLRASGVSDFRDYSENHPEVIANCASMMKVLDVNSATLMLYKARSKEELVGGLTTLFVPESFDAFRENLIALFEEKTDFEIEAINQTRSGELLHLIVRWSVLPGYEDSWSQVLVSCLDITDRKRAEEALRETHDYLESLLNYANAPIIVWDTEFRISRFNHAFEHLTGYTADEVIGQKLSILFPEASRAESLSKIDRTSSGEYWESVEIPILRNDGAIRLALWNSANIYAEDGTTLVATIAQGQDITDRKGMEDELRRSEALYRTIFEATGVPTVILNEDGTFQQVNAEGVKISGFRKEELEGKKRWTEFIAKKEDLEMMQEIHQLRRTDPDKAPMNYEFLFKDRYGNLRNIYVTATIIPGTKQSVVSFTDLTERKRAEEERDRILKALEAKNRELERFTYTVSHDLRSPLVTIQGFTGMLQKDLAQNAREKAETDLQYVSKAATKMDELLRATLQLSRIGRIANPPEDVSFGDIVQDALEQTAGELKATNADVAVAEGFPTVHVDRMRLAEMLVNLIGNSIKYRGEQSPPKIEIGYRVEGQETVFFVKDNGIGIDKSQHEKVFELFYKVDKSSKGTGAGLAIVKRIVEVHGGRIWLESEPGKGCTVYFTLPVVDH
jgi:PAS domain S-box-containing protein